MCVTWFIFLSVITRFDHKGLNYKVQILVNMVNKVWGLLKENK